MESAQRYIIYHRRQQLFLFWPTDIRRKCLFLLTANFVMYFTEDVANYWILYFLQWKIRHKQPQYTCQLFPRYRREIFILQVLGFLKMTQSFPKIAKEVRSLLKKSEVFQRSLWKSSSLRTCMNASSLPVLFTSKIRDREEGVVIYLLHMVFVPPYMGLS